jgi:hypothetical protein
MVLAVVAFAMPAVNYNSVPLKTVVPDQRKFYDGGTEQNIWKQSKR